MRPTSIFLALLALWFAAACSNTPQDARRQAAGSAVVTGTVLDASTGEPLSDAHVEGPHGTRATTDSAGRFEFSGLHAGDTGELTARWKDRRASLSLRPLREGSLEVVLTLARP